MAEHTPDFGLSYFGPGVPGSITDEGGKFTLDDRLLISRLFAAMATHNHVGGDKLADPSGTPALSLDSTTGALSGGLNVYYRISYVDQNNLETAASAEAVVSTPALLTVPSFPILTAEAMPGGDLNPGLPGGEYTYALTAFANGNQTPLGISATLTLDGSLPVVVVTFPDAGQDGQDQWGIWRLGPGEAFYTFVDAVDVINTEYVDDGAVLADADAGDPSHQPPTQNITNSTNSVVIDVPDLALVGATPKSTVKSWRIYRSFTSGSYAASSLLVTIVQTVNEDGSGGLITEFVDDGSIPLQQGQPLDVSQTLVPSVRLDGGGAGGAGPVALRSANGLTAWAISADLDGSLVTEPSAVAAGDGDLVLETIGQQFWKVTVNPDGSLQTTAIAEAVVGDTVFAAGDGPMVATPDASFAYHLTVDSTGTLITTAVGVHHPIPAPCIVGSGVPSPTMLGVFDGLVYKDRTDSFQEYTWDIDRWHKAGVAATAPTGAPKLWSGGGEPGTPIEVYATDDERSNLRDFIRVSLSAVTADGGYPVVYKVTATPLSSTNIAEPTDLWNLYGVAIVPAPGLIRVNDLNTGLAGGAFCPALVDLTDGATIAFKTNMYNFSGSAADGVAVVFQDPAVNDPTTLALVGNGNTLGAQGMHGTAMVGLEAFPSNNSVYVGHTDNAGTFTTDASATSSQLIRGLAVSWSVVVTRISSTSKTLTLKSSGGATLVTATVALPDQVYLGLTGATGGFADYHEFQDVTVVSNAVTPADLIPSAPVPAISSTTTFADDGVALRGDLGGMTDVGYSLVGEARNLIGAIAADSNIASPVDTRYIPNLWPDVPSLVSIANSGGNLVLVLNTPTTDPYAKMPDQYLVYVTLTLAAHDYIDGSTTQDSGWTQAAIFGLGGDGQSGPARDALTAGTTTMTFVGQALTTGTYKIAVVARNYTYNRSNLHGPGGNAGTQYRQEVHHTLTQAF